MIEEKKIKIYGLNWRIRKGILIHGNKKITKFFDAILVYSVMFLYVLVDAFLLSFKVSVFGGLVNYFVIAVLFETIWTWFMISFILALVRQYKWNYPKEV